MFKIIKKGSNNFWHIYNNGAKNVSISDFEVVLDDVLNTFVIVLRNGANIPQIALSVLDIIVIDETASSVEETFLTASQLRARLVVLGYTAYLGADTADAITGLVEAGTNVTITGTGTLADPYVISSSGGSGTTPKLQEVTDAGNEIINTAGNAKIVLDKENNGMFLYELVSGIWEFRGQYNNQGFSVGGFDGNASFDVNCFTGLLTISNGSDIVQFSTTSATKNGVEFATEDFALKRDGSNANSDVDVASVGYSVATKYLKVGSPTTQMEVRSENLSTNRTAQFQDKDYNGIADITDIPTALSELSEDTTHRLVTDTEKSTWNGKQNALGYTAEDTANKSSSYTASSTTTYPNTKALVDGLATKQAVLSYTPYKFIQTSQTAHTGTLSETIVATATINGSTFNTSDVMKVLYGLNKGATTSGATLRLKINTSNTLTGATTIATFNVTGTASDTILKRNFMLNGGNLYGLNFTSTAFVNDEANNATTYGSTAYNTANTLYLFFTIQLTASADSVTPNLFNIIN